MSCYESDADLPEARPDPSHSESPLRPKSFRSRIKPTKLHPVPAWVGPSPSKSRLESNQLHPMPVWADPNPFMSQLEPTQVHLTFAWADQSILRVDLFQPKSIKEMIWADIVTLFHFDQVHPNRVSSDPNPTISTLTSQLARPKATQTHLHPMTHEATLV